MKLYEKIKDLRKNRLKVSLKDFHKRLVDIFGEKAITYYSLCRIEKGYREALRLKSLYQICTGLGVTIKELKEGTEEEVSMLADIITRSERKDNKYIYNEKAYAEILSAKKLGFLALELYVEQGGKTNLEEDSPEVNNFEKLVIVMQGTLHAHIGTEVYILKKGDTLSFKSSIPHYFENNSKNKVKSIIIQNPKSF